ncbi:glycosyltransferase [Candidatus Microgenomates bacterium]|jgi:glycosyltransferase involved in cell wall biosynthesis|nr:MAG: glycosyltransferase [Candidatus Microgenomates bacterium]
MEKNSLPTISVLIPTLNAGRVLEECLKSISIQDYPKDKIEIIIADGGSVDNTLKIAKKYGAKIFENPLKTGETGKAVALKNAKNELVALIDSDNILPNKDWLKRMVEPFDDREINGSEPWAFTYRKFDGFIDRYCALMGMNDPFCYFIGNYDHLNLITNKWTKLNLEEEDKGSWLKLSLKFPNVPTIGANGALFRRKFLIEGGVTKDYLFDIDVIPKLSRRRAIKYAKVKISIVHVSCGSSSVRFTLKQLRRITDYLYYQKRNLRIYPWQKQDKTGLINFLLSCIFVFPLLYQSLRGYMKKPDPAWLFHPLACWITLFVYTTKVLSGFVTTNIQSREKWKQ